MANILIISAHPDDMEIGMGGTAAVMTSQNQNVISMILTDGRRSPNPFAIPPDELARMRKQEAEKAAEILGIRRLHSLDLPDLTNAQNMRAAVESLNEIIADNAPEQVYILHPELDRHPTHRTSGRITLEVLDRLPHVRPAVWAYEVWGLFSHWDRFEDISITITKKIAAVQAHKSQIAVVPYTEGIIGLNRWRAVFADPAQSENKCVFAEVFVRLR